jgi:hypothetical protein
VGLWLTVKTSFYILKLRFNSRAFGAAHSGEPLAHRGNRLFIF